jgi:hypothetical protein
MNSPLSLSRSVARCSSWLAVAVLMACSVSVDSEGGTQTQALIDRLPAGASAIAWIDIEALAATMPPEEWDEYEEMFQGDEDMQDLERFAEATGIDPREDMKQVAVAMMPGAGEEDNLVVLVSLAFDEGRLLALTADAETVSYEGATLYNAQDVFRSLEEAVDRPAEPREGEISRDFELTAEADSYLTILDEQTLAMGTEEALQVLIDVDGGRHDSLKMDPQMNDLISDVAGQGQIWFVAMSDTWDDQIGDLGQAGGMVPTTAIESIEVVTMSMRMGDGVTLRLAGVATTAEDAGLLADTLNGWTAMGKIMLQQSQPEMFDILDRGITVGRDDRTVHIEADLSAADIEALRSVMEDLDESVIGR